MQVLSQRPVLVEVAMEPKYNGDGERASVQRYSTSGVSVDDAMDAQLGEAERWYTEWRKKKAGGGRPSRSGGGGAGCPTRRTTSPSGEARAAGAQQQSAAVRPAPRPPTAPHG